MITGKITNNCIAFNCAFAEKDYMKLLPEVKWSATKKIWWCWITRDNIEVIKRQNHIFNIEGIDDIVNEKEMTMQENGRIRTSEVGLDFDKFTKIIPFAHQAQAIAFGIKNPSCGLFLEMGLGKTKTAIDIISYRHIYDKTVNNILIVCPISVFGSWEKEIACNVKVKYDIKILRGTREQKLNILYKDSSNVPLNFSIVNYESVRVLKDELLALRFDMIVLDESHEIKNHRAEQSQAILALGNKVEYKMILTGTPIYNRPTDVFNQYKFLDRFYLGDNYYTFRNEYCIMGGFEGKQIVGYKNLDKLKTNIESLGIVYKKNECVDLPPQIYETKEITMADEQRKIYNKAKKDFILEIKKNVKKNKSDAIVEIKNALARVVRLQQITGGYLVDIEGNAINFNTAKDEALDDIIYQNIDNHKIVVWCKYINEIRKLNERYKEYNPINIYGAIPEQLRTLNIMKFNTSPETAGILDYRLLIAQVETGGVGIDLSAADVGVFYSNSWSLGVRAQAESRIHRIGSQRHPAILYIDLICQDSIDEKILKAIAEKKDIADILVEEFKE